MGSDSSNSTLRLNEEGPPQGTGILERLRARCMTFLRMDRGIRHLNDPDGFQIPITPMERARLMARKPIDDEEITLSGVDALDDRRRERASTLLDLDIRNLDQKSDPSVEAPREPQVNQTRIVFQRTLTLVGPHYISPPPHSDTSVYSCLLYTSPSPRDGLLSRMPSSA